MSKDDLRTDEDSKKLAQLARKYIIDEAGSQLYADHMIKEFMKLCGISGVHFHRHCYFWKMGSEIHFQPLDSQGHKKGKIYDLKGWCRQTAKKAS